MPHDFLWGLQSIAQVLSLLWVKPVNVVGCHPAVHHCLWCVMEKPRTASNMGPWLAFHVPKASLPLYPQVPVPTSVGRGEQGQESGHRMGRGYKRFTWLPQKPQPLALRSPHWLIRAAQPPPAVWEAGHARALTTGKLHRLVPSTKVALWHRRAGHSAWLSLGRKDSRAGSQSRAEPAGLQWAEAAFGRPGASSRKPSRLGLARSHHALVARVDERDSPTQISLL